MISSTLRNVYKMMSDINKWSDNDIMMSDAIKPTNNKFC